MANPSRGVILYDGVCNLCHGFVRFVIDRDPAARFRFASLQSPTGRSLLVANGLDPDALTSLVFVPENGPPRTRTAAVLEVCRGLRNPWPLVSVLRVVPGPLRDFVYGIVARHRYRWFGKTANCPVMTPALRNRFLDLVENPIG